MWKKTLTLLLIPFLSYSQENIKLCQVPHISESYSETILVADLKRHLNILASDSLEGRETGKAGQKMAADYIMNHFKDVGIPPYKKKYILSKV